MARRGKRDEAYPRDWDDEAADDFTSSDLMVLSEDGATAHFIPLTPPKLTEEEAFGKKRERMHIGVARIGDGEIGTPDTWFVQDWPVSVRIFRGYRALREKYPEGFEGKQILTIVRDGVKNDQATVYHLSVVQPVTADVEDVVTELTAVAFAG